MKIEGIKYFKVQEWVPKQIFELFGSKSIRFLRYETVKMMDDLRTHFGVSMKMNTWAFNGAHQYRGYRQPDCEIGSFYSDHKMGIAADFEVSGMSSEEVQEEIQKNWKKTYKKFGITVLEVNTNGWTHVSRRFTGKDELLIIKP